MTGTCCSVGNIIVVGVTDNGATIGTGAVTDNRGNTYTRIGEVVNSTTADHGAIFWAKVANGTAPFAVSIGVSGTVAAHEYSNVNTWSPLDKVASATGSSKNPNSSSVTTTNDHDLFAGLAWSGTNGDTWSASAGYTLRENDTNNNTAERIATEDQVIASATTSAAIFSVPTTDQWLAMIGAFKPATTTSGGGSGASADATSSLTTLFKDASTTTFGGASYKIATTSGAITDTWTTNASQDWVMAAIALRPATSTSGGSSGTSATTTRYFLPDHLNSTNVVTDASGSPIEIVDYYPYGSTRIDQTTNNFRENKQFVGQYSDPETNLSYLQARYYDGSKADFLSEDPVFLGDPKQQVLTDPQSLNSYSYGNDNPITQSDPRGLWAISYNLASVGAEGGFGLFAGGSAGLSLNFVSGKDGGLALTFSSARTSGYLQNSTSYPASPTGNPSFIYGAFASGGCALQALCGRAVQYSGSFSPTVNSLDALNGAADAMNLNYERASLTRQQDADGNVTYGASFRGISKGASVSQYPVNTQTLFALRSAPFYNAGNQVYQSLSNASAGAFQSAVAQIQSTLNSLKAQVAQLVAAKSH